MKEKQQILDEKKYFENDASGPAEKKALILPITKPKKTWIKQSAIRTNI